MSSFRVACRQFAFECLGSRCERFSFVPPKCVCFASCLPATCLFPAPQFIPKFLSQSTKRIKELTRDLGKMPKVYTNDNELWEAYRKVVSAIREELKDLLTGGSDRAITGQDPSMNVVPHVTRMYKTYAANISKVSRRHEQH